jgi:dihydrofolate reductase
MTRIRVFVASSIDGFIAGANDELDWLPQHGDGAEDTFTPFMAEIGALLMGRRTYDVVQGFAGAWPYGQTPILVATQRVLAPKVPTVRAISGPIEALIAQAKRAAGARDVYIDGGALIRSALDAGLIDEVVITVIPTVLGKGLPLFAGVTQRHRLSLRTSRPIGAGMVQLTYDVDRG